ncbi:hypothetical protein V1520DRAFT_350473 [Lipomyces starkeyi]
MGNVHGEVLQSPNDSKSPNRADPLIKLEDGSVCLLDWSSAGFYPRLIDLMEKLTEDEKAQMLLWSALSRMVSIIPLLVCPCCAQVDSCYISKALMYSSSSTTA